MFTSQVRKAVIAAVETKIKEAEAKHEDLLIKAQKEYENDILGAKQLLQTKKDMALNECVELVFKSL